MQLENFETVEKLLDRVERLALKAGSSHSPATEKLLQKLKIIAIEHGNDSSGSTALYSNAGESKNILWSEIQAIIEE
jgi:hypothetical protein